MLRKARSEVFMIAMQFPVIDRQLFVSPSQVILIDQVILLREVFKHTNFTLRLACTLEGTFLQKRVCPPVGTQEWYRHPSHLLAAGTHRCWSDKKQCRSILNLLDVLKF